MLAVEINVALCVPATVLTGVFNLGPGAVFLDSLRCVGNESNLLQCGYNGQIGDTQCTSAQSAGVSCQREASEWYSSPSPPKKLL